MKKLITIITIITIIAIGMSRLGAYVQNQMAATGQRAAAYQTMSAGQ